MRALIRFNLIVLTTLALFVFSHSGFSRPSFEEKDLSNVGWSVTLVDVSYDTANNSTIFTYRLDAAGDEKDLSHWVLAIDIDETGLTSVAPDNLTSYGLDPTTGVMGIKWDAGQDAGTSMFYIVTVPGQVSIIDISYAVKGGTYYAVGITQGPGDSVVVSDENFNISGILYVDANLNGVNDANEPLLDKVSVSLLDTDGNVVTTTLSDSNGYYLFEELQPGDYSVVIQQSTPIDDFNEVLFSYLYSMGTTIVAVSIVDSHIDDADFGFGMNVNAILDDLNSEDVDGNGFSFPGTGKTIGYWKHQLSVAIKGKGRAHVDSTTMLAHLVWVESFLLTNPFQFVDGNEFQHAFDILSARTSIDVALLEKQLLATELNHNSGLGLSGDYLALQHVILAWSEYLVANHSLYARDDLLTAKDILDRINNLGH